MARARSILVAIAVVLVLALVGVVLTRLLDHDQAGVRFERVEAGGDATAVTLDEDRTRREAPELARLLDEASERGRSETNDAKDARAIMEYVQRIDAEFQRPPGGQPAVLWKGQQYRMQTWVS